MKAHEGFKQAIIHLARLKGWEFIYHTWSSMHSPAGFPDLIMLKEGHMLVAELKIGRDNLKPEQYFWLLEFTTITDDVYVWWDNEQDWNQIIGVL